jgi:hypothetical protein
MDSLEYQKRLAEYEERISFYEAKAKEYNYERSRFVLEVLKTIQEAKAAGTLPGNIDVVKKG